MEMDPQLVEKIVHEVKSQGVFDEFRRDVMADVDTKPAYQNLRQRVEVSVKKFLSEQRWTPDMNKNQLRERLRRHITETRANFLDVGVERIVDQVVNPKIDSVFQPRIEEITYKYLGLTPPPPLPPHQYEPTPLMHSVFPPLPMNGASSSVLNVETMPAPIGLLPTDLEQVSPDSDKATVKSECKDESMTAAADDDMDLETDDKPDDDYESPPFEPLKREVELRDSDMDTSDSPEPPPLIDDMNSSSQPQNQNQQQLQDTETQDTSVSVNTNAELDSSDKEPDVSRTHFLDVAEAPVGAAAIDIAYAAPEESQLSQVSSNSRISAAESRDFNEDNNTEQTQKSQSSGGGGSGGGGGVPTHAAVNISEEAQMPKFSENSSSEAACGGVEAVNGLHDQSGPQLHFDIKKDEIKFEGTERKTSLLPDASNEGEGGTSRDGVVDKASEIQSNSKNNSDLKNSETAEPNAAFHFCATTELNSALEVLPGAAAITSNLQTSLDSSFGSSLDDTNSMQLGGTEEKTKGDVASADPPLAVTNNETTNSTKHSSETAAKHISSSANSSSSSSRHKKHSKDKRRRSHEKDRHHRSSKSGSGGGGGESGKSRSGDKEKERDKDKEKEKEKDKEKEKEKEKEKYRHNSSRSKHSSSSSSNSKHARNSSSNAKSLNALISSNPIEFQSDQQETKRERRRDGGSSSDKHRHRSSSSSAVASNANNGKEHSKQHRKTAPVTPIDDHNESKEKLHWRKSTDSDDEDKSPGSSGNAGSGAAGNAAGNAVNANSDNKSNSSSSNSKTKSKNGNSVNSVKSTEKDAVADEIATKDSASTCTVPPRSNKVIILNDILQNPATDFIALESTNTQANHVQIVSSSITTHTLCSTSPPQSPLDLHFFEENSSQFVDRLRLLDNAMDRCRKVINSLRFDTMSTSQEEMEEEEEDHEEVLEKCDSQTAAKIYGSVTGDTVSAQAMLLIDCTRYDGAEFDETTFEASEPPPPKRFKTNDGTSKPSPTPSDTSLNSKENEAFDKNMVDSKKIAYVRRRSIDAVQKLSQQQRYASEDLYKPRPILSQRSRRRGVDSVI